MHWTVKFVPLFCLSIFVTGVSAQPQLPSTPATTPANKPEAAQFGSITGSIVDKDGAMITNAQVTLTQQGSNPRQATSSSDGSFLFTNVPPGPFDISFSARGFATQIRSGTLQPGQELFLPPIQLTVATMVQLEVKVPTEEIAEEQIHVEEQQHLLGVIPNFYVSYIANAAPLTPRQKFELAWKQTINPVSFVIAGITAGLEQANDSFSGYGQGMQGYGKRYGATLADFTIGTFVGGAIFPSLLKQDPRYFYKGTGNQKSRLLYAISRAVICRGDNGRWQPSYSSILGGLAAGGISNLYYPASNRNGAALTFENAAIGIGGTALGNIFQEFFSRKLTPHAPSPQPKQD